MPRTLVGDDAAAASDLLPCSQHLYAELVFGQGGIALNATTLRHRRVAGKAPTIFRRQERRSFASTFCAESHGDVGVVAGP